MAEGVETRIHLTPDILSFLQSVMNNGNCKRSLKSKIRIALITQQDDEKETGNEEGGDVTKQPSIQYEILKEAHEFYTEFNHYKKNFIDLHSLVKSSKVFNETIPEPKRSPELVQRLQKLKAEQEQRDYDGMVKNVKTKKMTLGQEMGSAIRSTGQQFMTIVNFVLSVAATFAFSFVASQYAFTDDLGLRLIFSIVLATVVALAEIYFMAKVEI